MFIMNLIQTYSDFKKYCPASGRMFATKNEKLVTTINKKIKS